MEGGGAELWLWALIVEALALLLFAQQKGSGGEKGEGSCGVHSPVTWDLGHPISIYPALMY